MKIKTLKSLSDEQYEILKSYASDRGMTLLGYSKTAGGIFSITLLPQEYLVKQCLSSVNP